MGSKAPSTLDSSSRSLHRYSFEEINCEDAVVEEYTDEKTHYSHRHHHHRRRHHHRLNHSKKDVKEVVPYQQVEAVDNEMEEGEILEEEDRGFLHDAVLDVPDDVVAKGGDVRPSDEVCIFPNNNDMMSVGERQVSKNTNDMEDGEINQGGNFRTVGVLVNSNEDHGRKVLNDKPIRSVSPMEVSLNENGQTNSISKDLIHDVKSRSSQSQESELSSKRKRRDESDCLSSEYDFEGNKLQRRSESSDANRKQIYDKKSTSLEIRRKNNKESKLSSSRRKHLDETNCEGSSKSGTYLREQSYERDQLTSHRNSSDSHDNAKSYLYYHERGDLHNKLDQLDLRSRKEKDKLYRTERERSSSVHRGHDGWEDRHDGLRRNKDRERDRRRERNSIDCSRVRGVYLECEKDRTGAKDLSKEKKGVRDDSRDRHQDRKRESLRERELDSSKRMTRESVRDYESRDSSRLRPSESDYYKDRKKFKESSKESTLVKRDHTDIKEKKPREENEEYYQEKIEQQLAMQEEEDPEKIIEESRRRRQAILEKYNKQKVQSNVEPPSKNQYRDISDVDSAFLIGKLLPQNGNSTLEKEDTSDPSHDTLKCERSSDMFCDDIFGESPASARKVGKEESFPIVRNGLHDNWDDAEGYYSYRFGEVIGGHYEVIAAHGKGVFSSVVRAKDLKAGKNELQEVAIKIIRNNDTMYKAGMEELVILKKLAGADPEDKRHCVRFISSFKYRNHLCLVFESLHMNLREVLKKFGRNIGLKLTAVRAYAKQLFIALKHLRNCGVLHCDIKPDNMLVNEAKNVFKLCDFGNAMFAGKNEITPYLVSRFYRSPEIILGLLYDHPMDMWSVGCCLFELYNGKVLFPGPTNNDMLRLHMELKGTFPKKMLRKAAFTDQHFDRDLNFCATEEDPVTKKAVKRLLLNVKPKDMGAILSGFPEEDPKLLGHFKDLLDRIFVLDPEKRLTVSQALSHPFITGK